MAEFRFPPREPKPAPAFQKPKTLVTFSYDDQHNLHIGSNSALRYFSEPPSFADLNYGFDRWIRRPDERGRLDSLLKCLDANAGAAQASRRLSVVSWRGVMTKIVTAPYEEREGWELNVMMLGPLLLLEEHLTDQKLYEKNNQDARQKQMTYHGYSFESYCTKDESGVNALFSGGHGAPRGWGGDVNTNVQHCHIVKSKLGRVRLVMGGEVDCAKNEYNGQTDSLMELKTSMEMKDARDRARFRRKLLKFWAQSFLLGIPEIRVGFRTHTGKLIYTIPIETLSIPSSDDVEWDANYALDSAEQFLLFLHDKVSRTRESDADVWRVTFVPGRGMRVRKLEDEREVGEVVNGEDRVGFVERGWFEAHR